MQYKVPQNIDLEDKIVGPFTMIQFLYLLIGGSLTYIAITAFGTGILGLGIAFPVALLFLALTFVKVQDQPFSKFLVAVVQFATRPKLRMWHQIGNPPELVITKSKIKDTHVVKREKITKSSLEQLAANLDTKGNQPNIAELEENEQNRQEARKIKAEK